MPGSGSRSAAVWWSEPHRREGQIDEELTAFTAVEHGINEAVQWLRLAIETMGAMVIAIGVCVALVAFVRAAIMRRAESYNDVRLTLARYLAVALEFQLGADILSTAIAPSWTQIGKLGAIAVIRTGLNFFLSREMEAEAAHAREARRTHVRDG